ncbi:hypothetical protein [Streptomyces sp. AK02-01A]|uniref:hypothetical protein n=1 Tax=Streptomyces sp. AK02-01A TaxID=3028648 RepID=UPI0029A75DB9|nr:hypothetical protein [Streptomyces sp. AK02-01A]MDX3850309.1 hypothetical protein [Streptomyces sp. AK02-01A]
MSAPATHATNASVPASPAVRSGSQRAATGKELLIELWVSLISAAVAVVSIAVSSLNAARTVRLQHGLETQRYEKDREDSAEEIVSRYREPLLRSAFELQSRLYNIVALDFFDRHHQSDDLTEWQYARDSTLFRLGQYFGWAEILRQGIQYIDLGSTERTRELTARLDTVSHVFANTDWHPRTSILRLFRDEQRAIGECLVERGIEDPRGQRCLGYVQFMERLENDPSFGRWFARLSQEIDSLQGSAPQRLGRLIGIQHELIAVIEFLDPDSTRFPAAHRGRIPPQAAPFQ